LEEKAKVKKSSPAWSGIAAARAKVAAT